MYLIYISKPRVSYQKLTVKAAKWCKCEWHTCILEDWCYVLHNYNFLIDSCYCTSIPLPPEEILKVINVKFLGDWNTHINLNNNPNTLPQHLYTVSHTFVTLTHTKCRSDDNVDVTETGSTLSRARLSKHMSLTVSWTVILANQRH